MSHYDYDKACSWLQDKGRELYGPRFDIREEDKQPVITGLLAWFLKDLATAEKHGISLDKGVLLTGPIGCGKTSLMTLFRLLQQPAQRFIMRPCREITFDFIQDGYEVIDRYTRQSFQDRTRAPKEYCFDDLGTEKNLKYYGNECNVMAEILLSRYELFMSKKMITHITTNLSASEIEEYYGNRLRSRMREMFNLISFEADAVDKRK